VAIWPFRPYRPVREAVAACWTAIGDLPRAGAGRVVATRSGRLGGAGSAAEKAREALEDARAALGLARAGRQGETKRGLQLLVLYEIAELLLGDMAAVLEALRARTERGELLPESAARAVRGAQPSAIRDRAGGDRSGACAGFTRAPRGRRQRPSWPRSLRAWWRRPRQAIESVRALQRGGEGPPPPGARAPPDEWPSLRDALARGSLELQHALRVAIVATARRSWRRHSTWNGTTGRPSP